MVGGFYHTLNALRVTRMHGITPSVFNYSSIYRVTTGLCTLLFSDTNINELHSVRKFNFRN